MPRTLDLDAHDAIAAAATPGPWDWFGNVNHYEVYLATVNHGRICVMEFARWGMRCAQPRFQVRRTGADIHDGVMRSLGDLAQAKSPLGPRFEVPYRRDFQGIGHPDAVHIAANDPTTVHAMIERIRELEHHLKHAANAILQNANGSFASAMEAYATDIRAIVNKGVVLP